MADVTPVRGYPYPTPDDARGAGANKIRDLALAIEADVQSLYDSTASVSYFTSPVATGSAVSIHPGGAAGVGLTGPLDNTADWTYDAGTATYTGPPRAFTVSGSCSLHNSSGGELLLDLMVGGSLRMRAEYQDLSASGAAIYWGPGALTFTGVLPTGTPVALVAHAPAGTEVWYPTLTIHSVGAA